MYLKLHSKTLNVINKKNGQFMQECIAYEEFNKLLSKKAAEQVVADTMVGGATLTKLLGTSAWYAPGAAAASVVESVLGDQKRIIPCSCYLEGEYGQSDIMIGVPAVIGRKGIEKIVKIDLTAEEKAAFEASADAVRKVNQVLYETNAI